MTFFSRCDATQVIGSAPRSAGRRWVVPAFFGPLAGFAEELGILFRYAAGLDYYGRDGAPHGR